MAFVSMLSSMGGQKRSRGTPAAMIANKTYEGEDIDGDGGSEKNAPSIEEADEVANYETDDEGEGATKERRARCRNAYMIPPPGTPIAIILDNTRKMLENPNRTLALGMDPLSFPGGPGNANRYLENELWQFIWLPFEQFCSQVSLDNIGCINGCDCGSLKLNGKRWHPQFKHDEIVWVLYQSQRIVCKTCKRHTSTIDPRFLAKMPTTVVERQYPVLASTGVWCTCSTTSRQNECLKAVMQAQ
eukprot:scaffold3902_cov53-Attheya_sp.AAC.7